MILAQSAPVQSVSEGVGANDATFELFGSIHIYWSGLASGLASVEEHVEVCDIYCALFEGSVREHNFAARRGFRNRFKLRSSHC
jgi:hypothetical protein